MLDPPEVLDSYKFSKLAVINEPESFSTGIIEILRDNTVIEYDLNELENKYNWLKSAIKLKSVYDTVIRGNK